MCSGAPNYLGSDTVAKCGDIYRDYGLDPVEYDAAHDNEMINFDLSNFNSVFNALFTIFQIITLEGWSLIMYNYQDTVSYITASVFFVFVILVGSFTTLNLVLAQIMNSFLKQEEKRKEREKEQLSKSIDLKPE